MPRLNTNPIAQADIEEFLDMESDFSFEMESLRLVERLGFTCEHGGTYTDPVTQKTREFDIRARKQDDKAPWFLSLAIECKNLRENFPLLVSLVERAPSEAFHDVIHFKDTRDMRALVGPQRYRARGQNSIYLPSVLVGKQLNQIGRTQSGEIHANDSSTFDRVTQVLGSVHDLVEEKAKITNRTFLAVVLPVLLVPEKRLWGVSYDKHGQRLGPPDNIDHCSILLGKSFSHRHTYGSTEYTLSHLEIVTPLGLERIVESLMRDPGGAFSAASRVLENET